MLVDTPNTASVYSFLESWLTFKAVLVWAFHRQSAMMADTTTLPAYRSQSICIQFLGTIAPQALQLFPSYHLALGGGLIESSAS